MEFSNLLPCDDPECGAEYHIDGRRLGPALIDISKNLYRVMCMNCWNGGEAAKTKQKAIDNWNEGKRK